MTKSTKRNIIISAILSMFMSASLVAGATFALFTSESKVNIAATSGKVNVIATVDDLKTYSGVNLTGNSTTDQVVLTETQGTFTNGGTAAFNSEDANKLELTNITPGDKATFKITVTNYSNVKVKYRTKIASSEDDGLFAGLKFNIGGVMVQSSSIWKNLDPASEEGTTVSSYDCYVELPSDRGDNYQGKSCKIAYTVEAIQGNAATTDENGAPLGFTTATVNVETTGEGTTANETTLASSDSVSVSESETKAVASATVPAGAKLESGATSLVLNIYETDTESNFTIKEIKDDNTLSVKTLEVEMKGLSSDNSEYITVDMYVGKGLNNFSLYHNSEVMTAASSADDVNNDQYYYNRDTGFVTLKTKSFSPFTYVCDAANVARVKDCGELVSALKDGKITLIKLDNDITIDSTYNTKNRLYIDRDDLIIDLNEKTLTASNCALTITGDNVTIKNGNMIATTITSGQTNGSYTMQINTGINVLVEKVTMTGGVNVSGDNSASSDPDAIATIESCNITATNYYAVCAQHNSVVRINNSTLKKGKNAFFWVEKKGYSESGSAAAEVDSKISYENVTFEGEGDLYNKVGVAPVEINNDGNKTWAHDVYTLEKAFDDANIIEVKLLSDIELTEVLGLAHSLTIDFGGKTIEASGDQYQHVIQVLNTKTSANKLIFKDSVGGGKFSSTYGGILLYSSNAAFELNDVTMECTDGTAIAVADYGYYIVDDDYEFNAVVEKTSIVMNSGKIITNGANVIRSGNDFGGKGHSVTINGGSIEYKGGFSAIFLNNNCVLTINNCDFTANSSRPIFVDGKDNSSDDNVESSVIINNINFKGNDIKVGTGKPDIQYVICLSSDATGENVVIYKGTFTVDDETTTYDAECFPYKNS